MKLLSLFLLVGFGLAGNVAEFPQRAQECLDPIRDQLVKMTTCEQIAKKEDKDVWDACGDFYKSTEELDECDQIFNDELDADQKVQLRNMRLKWVTDVKKEINGK